MCRLSSIILAIMLSISAMAKSPHGDKLKIKCDVCHNKEGWTMKRNSFDHAATSFKLVGQHQTVDCRKCHTDLIFSNAKSTCVSCHKDMHQQTVGQDCERCHTALSWGVQNISKMHQQSRFPLSGQHAQIDCYLCHKSASLLRFDPMGTECADCHLKNFTATTNPSHIASKFPKDCLFCHTEKGWQPAKFDHNTNTTFPITGGHIGVDCAKCHTKGYTGTSKDCISCHLNDYNTSTRPAHTAAKFSTDCKTCHTVNAWKPSTFNHNTSTDFTLRGGHIGVDCISCHSKGFAGTPTTCVSCHLNNYNVSKSPAHAAAKFSTDCKTCHTETAWKPSTFNHSTSTTFPLNGFHKNVDCMSCHSKGYAGTPTTCVGCHLNNYNATTNPVHAAAKFSTDCKTCHTETAWKPSTFNHNTSTAFPLTGGHFGVDCIKCHAKGYTGTSPVCSSCHLNDFNATTSPSHVTAKFTTDCKICHTSAAWKPSSFNHNTGTTFPLTGGHLGVDCIKCHANGYVGTSTACVSCHLTKYNATRNPAHAAAKFPTNCEACHSKTAWAPSTFNHDAQYFKIYSGKHNGKWTLCSECHTNATNYAVFSCLNCHEHAKASMDSEHKGTNGYVYNSTNCLSCHPKI